MAKRYPVLKQYSRTTKKPKLEISVSETNKPTTSAAVKEQPSRDVPGPSNNMFCGFDDDDDDLILLASQQVEKLNNWDNDIDLNVLTFSNFVPGVLASTQKPPIKNDDDLNDLFEDDIDDWTQVLENPNPPTIQGVENNKFKIPPPKKTSAQCIATQKNIEKSHDTQLQFLINRIDSVNKSNDELTKELDSYKDKMETKDGEVSMLRNELRHIKQQLDHLRMEKIQVAEYVKIQMQDKIKTIERHMKAKETELEFKTGEVSRLKIKCLDETQRFPTESSFLINDHIRPEVKRFTDQRIFHLDVSTNWPKDDKYLKYSIPLEIFDNSTRIGAMKFHENISKELEKVQNILARLQSFETLTKEQHLVLEEGTKKSIRIVIPDFWNYVHSLEFPEFESSDCDYLLDRKNDISLKSIFQAEQLYVNERAILHRRYIAGLSLICNFLPNVCKLIFTENHKEYTLIQIMIDALEKLGYSNEISSHLSTLEAYSMLLKVLIKNLSDDEQFYKPLVGLLKCLIFCRPNDRTFVQLSQCMVNLSNMKANNNLVNNLLCTQSVKKSFSYHEADKMYRFFPDSCILQVYGGLLEAVFPSNCHLSAIQYDLLCELCYNNTKFLTNLFENSQKWIQKISADDFHESNSSSSTDKSTCHCYNKLCKSFTVLFYQLLHEWIRVGRSRSKEENNSKIIKTVNLGSRLLYDIFHLNFKRSIFYFDGFATKNQLYIICDYLSNNFNKLKIDNCNRIAIETLKKSHILTDALLCSKTVSKSNQVELMDVDVDEMFGVTAVLNKSCVYDNVFEEIILQSNWNEVSHFTRVV